MDWKELQSKANSFTSTSEEMDERLARLANDTWDIIGGDVLNACEDCGQKAIMSRNNVIEVVCDADHMQTNGNDPDAYAYYLYLRDKNPKHRNKVMKEAFPFARYGW